MHTEDFSKVMYAVIARCTHILGEKAEEYANDFDRLKNFKDAGSFQEETPEEAWLGMWSKHIVSIKDFIKTSFFVKDITAPMYPMEKWQEKIHDAINYLILLEALLVERYYMGQVNRGEDVIPLSHPLPRRRKTDCQNEHRVNPTPVPEDAL